MSISAAARSGGARLLHLLWRPGSLGAKCAMDGNGSIVPCLLLWLGLLRAHASLVKAP